MICVKIFAVWVRSVYKHVIPLCEGQIMHYAINTKLHARIRRIWPPIVRGRHRSTASIVWLHMMPIEQTDATILGHWCSNFQPYMPTMYKIDPVVFQLQYLLMTTLVWRPQTVLFRKHKRWKRSGKLAWPPEKTASLTAVSSLTGIQGGHVIDDRFHIGLENTIYQSVLLFRLTMCTQLPKRFP